jgi:hypothetical protein
MLIMSALQITSFHSYRAAKCLSGTLLFAFFFVSLGCSFIGNESTTPSPDVHFTATLNGEPWTAEVQPSGINSEDYFDIVGIRYSETSFWNEQLVFSLPFRGTGSYSLVWGERQGDLYGASFFEVDGDARLATYYPLPDSATNYVRVTSYDPDTGIMKGRFRTTVVVSPEDRLDEPGEPPRRRVDTLRFTDGSFRVVIEDRR